MRNKEKGTYRIRIRKKSINNVVELVKDIMPIEYHYKIGILKAWAFFKSYYMLEHPKVIMSIPLF